MEKFFVLEQRWLLLLVLLLLTKRSESCHLRLHARHLSLHRGHACYLRLQRRHTSSLRELWLHHRSVSCAVAAAVTRGERVVAVLVSKGLARKNVNSSSIIIFYSTLTCKKEILLTFENDNDVLLSLLLLLTSTRLPVLLDRWTPVYSGLSEFANPVPTGIRRLPLFPKVSVPSSLDASRASSFA